MSGLSVSVRCGEGGWRQAGEMGAHAPSGVALFVSLVPFVCSLRKLLEGLGCSSAWLSPPLLLKCTVLHILWAGAACRLGRSLVDCPRSGTFSHSFIQVLSCSVLGFGAGGNAASVDFPGGPPGLALAGIGVLHLAAEDLAVQGGEAVGRVGVHEAEELQLVHVQVTD